MRNLVNNLFSWYYHQRYAQIERIIQHPHEIQRALLSHMIEVTKHTVWGKKYDFRSIRTPEDFSNRIPVQDYDSLKPFIKRMMEGEKDILWSDQVTMFSKSSGTTNDKSKFIPVSKQNFRKCHIKGSWDTLTILYHNKPYSKIFTGKSFVMGGSYQQYKPHLKTIYGDVSSLMIKNMPLLARPFFEPDYNIATSPDWESKIEVMAQVATNKKIANKVVMVGGVPTWTIVFFRRLLELTGKDNILDVWPNFEAYIHGGVSIAPYKEQFQKLLPSDKVQFAEDYNASEGYFATQLDYSKDDMLLLLDNGVYYEFLPMEEWHKENPKTVTLDQVEVGKNYALIITTNAGLWRYKIGDTITFTSTDPYCIKITGRTKQFVNAFGEEVMVANTDKALALTCQELDAIVSEYTVAPIYFKGNAKGGHEWLVEFEKAPKNLNLFTTLLDKNLQQVNSDYEAKRYKNMALKCLQLKPLPNGTFFRWMKSKGKYGNQNKIPRLANDRKYIEDILTFVER